MFVATAFCGCGGDEIDNSQFVFVCDWEETQSARLQLNEEYSASDTAVVVRSRSDIDKYFYVSDYLDDYYKGKYEKLCGVDYGKYDVIVCTTDNAHVEVTSLQTDNDSLVINARRFAVSHAAIPYSYYYAVKTKKSGTPDNRVRYVCTGRQE